MNEVHLKGNMVRDPEVREVSIGGKQSSVTNFTIAVSRSYVKKNGEREQTTDFIDCEAWDSGAEYLGRNVKKGDPILISRGSLKQETWTDSETGTKRSKMKVRVGSFDKLARFVKQDSDSSPSETPVDDKPKKQETSPPTQDEDDIPF